MNYQRSLNFLADKDTVATEIMQCCWKSWHTA